MDGVSSQNAARERDALRVALATLQAAPPPVESRHVG